MGDRFMSGKETGKFSPKAEEQIVNGYEQFMKRYNDDKEANQRFRENVEQWQQETAGQHQEINRRIDHFRDAYREDMDRHNKAFDHLWNLNTVLATLLCTPFMRFLNRIFMWYYLTLEEQVDLCKSKDSYCIQIHPVLSQNIADGSAKQSIPIFKEDLKKFKEEWRVKNPWKELRKSF